MDTTILIPARIRNAQDVAWLKEAVKSAASQGKIIIGYNNCTFTPLPKFAKKATIVEFKAKNLAETRNNLVKLVKSPYFFFLDADDLLPEDTIPRMEEFIKLNPDKYVYGGTIIFGDGQFEVPARDFDCKALTLGVYFPNGVLQPTQNFDIVGEWDTSLDILEDKEWWIRAAEQGVIGAPFKDHLTYKYRQHANSLVATYRDTDTWKEVLAYIELKHKPFFEGVYPMCCGGTNTSTVVNQAAFPVAVAQTGEIQLHYMLGTSTVSYWGVVSGRQYKVSATHPDINVDVRDVRTEDRSHPGLLQLNKNNQPVFRQVE